MDITTLLGLGPKFCIQSRGVQLSNTMRMTDRFKRDDKLKYYLISNSFDDDDKSPILHRKNEKWQSPKAIGPIEDYLKRFVTDMRLETSKRAHLKNTNLTKLQHNGLNFLRNNKTYAALIADKIHRSIHSQQE